MRAGTTAFQAEGNFEEQQKDQCKYSAGSEGQTGWVMRLDKQATITLCRAVCGKKQGALGHKNALAVVQKINCRMQESQKEVQMEVVAIIQDWTI